MSGSFDKLIQNIDRLETTNFKAGLSIKKLLLSTKGAVKKLIAAKNPKMSPFDIDLMVDGAEELVKKILEREDNKKKSDAELKLSRSSRDEDTTSEGNLEGSGESSPGLSSDDTTITVPGTNVSSSDLSSNSPNSNVAPPAPAPSKFVYVDYMDSPNDYVVEIYFKGRWIKTQVHSITSAYTKEDALEGMKFQGSRFGFLDSNGVPVEEEPDPPVPDTTPQSGDTLSNNTTGPTNPSDEVEKKRQEELKEKEAQKEKRKKEVEDSVSEYKKIYDSKIAQYEKQVDEIARDIETSVFVLESKLKELVSKLINSLISAAVAIPAMVIKIVLPFFNFPDAIQGILTLVQLFLDLVAVVKDLVPFLKPLKYLPLVTSKENLAVIGEIMNPVIEGIFAILAPIKALENTIFLLLNALFEFLTKTKESNFRKATKKLKKLGHLKKIVLPIPEEAINLITKVFWGTDNLGKQYDYDADPPNEDGERLKLQDGTPVTVYSFSPDDVPEIISMLDIFVVRNNRVVAYRQKIKYKDKDTEPEDLIRTLVDEIERAAVPVEIKGTEEFDQFVYDIKLPDGSVILGVSEEAVEYYRTKYTLNFLYSD